MTPEIGATSSASRRLMRLVPSCVCEAVNWARGRLERRAARLERRARNELLLSQALVRRVLALSLVQLRARRVPMTQRVRRRGCSVSARSSVPSVCPGPNPGPFSNCQRQQGAAGPGTHHGGARCDQGAGEFDRDRKACKLRRNHFACGEFKRHIGGRSFLALSLGLARLIKGDRAAGNCREGKGADCAE